MKSSECDEIVVIVAHSIGEIETPIETWLRNGPGKRKYISPKAVICKDTGEKLPLSTIPLRYQNNLLSRLLISIGVLKDPWQGD